MRGRQNDLFSEIEQTLIMHSAVPDAAAVGILDEALGERIVAFVRLA